MTKGLENILEGATGCLKVSSNGSKDSMTPLPAVLLRPQFQGCRCVHDGHRIDGTSVGHYRALRTSAKADR